MISIPHTVLAILPKLCVGGFLLGKNSQKWQSGLGRNVQGDGDGEWESSAGEVSTWAEGRERKIAGGGDGLQERNA